MKMKNKRAKQMICDVVLQGRVAIWHGEESEIFAAKNLKQLNDEFGMNEEFPDKFDNVISKDYRFWWKPCIDEEGNVLPLICGVYGGADDVAQVTTSYN